jgi:glycolate oxidase
VAHAGDGNLHPLMITASDDDAARVRAQDAFERIVEEAIAIGGTVTGSTG